MSKSHYANSSSIVLKQIAMEIDVVTRKLIEAGRKGSDAFEKVKAGAARTGSDTKDANKSLTSMGEILTNMSKALTGPVTIATGLIAIGKAMEGVARSRVQIQALSVDIGFSTKYISIFEGTLKRLGASAGDARGISSKLGSELVQLRTLGRASPLYKTIAGTLNQPEFAEEMLTTARESIDKAGNKIIDRYGTTVGEKSKTFYANSIGISKSYLQRFRKTSEGVTASYGADYSESAEYLKKVEELNDKLNTAWVFTAEVTIKALNQMDSGFKSSFRKLDPYINKMLRMGAGNIVPEPSDPTARSYFELAAARARRDGRPSGPSVSNGSGATNAIAGGSCVWRPGLLRSQLCGWRAWPGTVQSIAKRQRDKNGQPDGFGLHHRKRDLRYGKGIEPHPA